MKADDWAIVVLAVMYKMILQTERRRMQKARTGCFYGNFGKAKTTQLYFMAVWLWNTFQLKSRLISLDGKFAPFILKRKGGKSLVDEGIVQLSNLSNSATSLADVRALSEGYWPRKYKNKEGEYFAKDDRCMTDWAKEGIGAYLFDGISPLSDNWLVHISDQSPSMGKVMTAPWEYREVPGGGVTGEGYDFHGMQDGYYNIVQKELMRVIKGGYNQLPVKYVMYTAMIEKGVENYRRKRVPRGEMPDSATLNASTMYGPKAAGQALTPFLGGWFDDVFHLDDVEVRKDDKLQKIRVAWYEDHPDELTDVPYRCRVDLLPEDYPKLQERFKHGFIPLGFERGVDKFYEWVEGLNV